MNLTIYIFSSIDIIFLKRLFLQIIKTIIINVNKNKNNKNNTLKSFNDLTDKNINPKTIKINIYLKIELKLMKYNPKNNKLIIII